MAILRPLFSSFISLVLLLLHLGCFIFTTSQSHHHSKKLRKPSPLTLRHSSPSASRLKSRKHLSSAWSFFKTIFSSITITSTTTPNPVHQRPTTPSPFCSTRSSLHSSVLSGAPPDTLSSNPPLRTTTTSPPHQSDISIDQHFFPLRNDIYPCPACGEIFTKPNLLEQHQSIKHAVSEVIDGDSGKNIVQTIFNTGWPDKTKNPTIHRIVKIHNSPKTLTKFEEYRELVKSKATRNVVGRRRDERCIADGNELLRFHCATFLCDLGQNGNSSLCSHQYCSVCGILTSGFSPKMDGISTLPTSWRAHVAIPEDIEEEFKFMHVRRAMLVCRVIAGWIGCDPDIVDKNDPGFDSLVYAGNGIQTRLVEEDELLVFNPRAVLPCFVIIYTV